MKVGAFVYATQQGLGYLARDFFENGIINSVVIKQHHCYQNHPEWYPNNSLRISSGNHSSFLTERVREWIESLDRLVVFETPFHWEYMRLAKELGVKTIFIPMYECTPKVLPVQPDKFICPSLLDLLYFPRTEQRESLYVPVPVDVKAIPFVKREKAETFIHNVGHGGLRGRNGTDELLQALSYIKSPARIIINCQDKPKAEEILRQGQAGGKLAEKLLVIVSGAVPERKDLYQGDVFVFPEKFNGLSLPIQEAFASGMLVMTTNRYPNNHYLPTDPLIAVDKYIDTCVAPSCLDFKEAVIDPKEIAATIDSWYGKDISNYSEIGKRYAEQNSWDALKGKWMEAIQ
jgi:hypothetical protein